MSPPPPPSRNTPQTPLSTTTSANTRNDNVEEREIMAANALVAMANAGTMDSDKASAPATNANSKNETIAAEANKHVDNKADDAVKLPKQGGKKFVLKLGGSSKKVDGKKDEHPFKVEKDTLREPRKLATETSLAGSPSTGIIGTDKAHTPASKADLESRYIASMLRRGDLKISDDALKVLKQAVREFVLDQLEKNKRGELDNPIKAQQQILAAKREAARKERQKRDDEKLAALLKRMTDAIECQKEPGESEEERLMRETVKRVDVATQKDKFRKTADRKQAFRNLEATAARYEDLYDPSFDFGVGIRLSVFGQLEEVEGEQLDGLAKTKQWVVLEDAGVDYRRRKKLAGEGRLTVETALRLGASVLEFTFEPTAGIEKPAESEDPGTVVAANTPVHNAKLKGSSADVQQPAVAKLDASGTLRTSTATIDDVLASALSGIAVSKTETRPNMPSSEPRNQPPSDFNRDPRNPFYRPDMTLAIAAQNIHAYFLEATDWLTFWHISTSASILAEISHKPTSTLSRIFCHLRWTAEILRFGRTGWDLRRLPDNFFEDVLPLIMVACGKLEKLGEWKGCGGMMIGAWKDAEEVGEMLATVGNVRVRDGRGT